VLPGGYSRCFGYRKKAVSGQRWKAGILDYTTAKCERANYSDRSVSCVPFSITRAGYARAGTESSDEKIMAIQGAPSASVETMGEGCAFIQAERANGQCSRVLLT
jgi:hypothetical protein